MFELDPILRLELEPRGLDPRSDCFLQPVSDQTDGNVLMESCAVFFFSLSPLCSGSFDRDVAQSSVAVTTDVSQPLGDAGSAPGLLSSRVSRVLVFNSAKCF